MRGEGELKRGDNGGDGSKPESRREKEKGEKDRRREGDEEVRR